LKGDLIFADEEGVIRITPVILEFCPDLSQ
jgi:hypothetical protein